MTPTPVPAPRARLRRLVAAGLLFVAVVLAYAPWSPRQFAGFDDASYIRDNPLLRNADGLRRIWITFESDQYYPLTFTSYWIEYHFWGDWATGYYATNVVLHAITAVIALAFLCRIGLPAPAAWLAAALFALHPQQVESVAWLAERKNVLSGALALLAMLLYVRSAASEKWGPYVAALVLFLAALLAKTAIMTLAASLPLLDVMVFKLNWKRVALRGWPLLVLAAAGAATTIFVEQQAETFAVAPPLRPLAAAGALWFYIGKFLWPVPLLAFYPQWNVTASGWIWWTALGGLVAAALLFLALRRRWNGVPSWGMAHYCITLLPILGLIPFGYLELAPVADHFVYLALLGPVAALGAAGAGLLSKQSQGARKVAGVVGLFVLVVAGVATFRAAQVWAEPERLFANVLKYNPENGAAHQNLGFLRRAAGDFPAAAMHYEKFLASFPNKAGAQSDYGAVLLDLNRPADALPHLEQACRLNPRDALARLNLGAALGMSGRLAEAEQAFAAGVALSPASARGHLNWAYALDGLGRRKEADVQFRAALALSPTDPVCLTGYADALAEWGRFTEARKLAQAALQSAQAAGDAALVQHLQGDLQAWPRMDRP